MSEPTKIGDIDPQLPKKGRGRPSKITPELAKKIFLLSGYGLSEEKIAAVLDIDYTTIFRAKKDVEFCKVLAQSKDEADLAVINALYHRAIGYSHPETKVFCHEGDITEHEVMKHYPPDTAAAMSWLVNRRREEWRKEVQHEENKIKPAMIRLWSKIDGKEAASIRQNGSQVDVLLGQDFVADVKGANGSSA